ncbi:hypothetical protein [Streptomyces sp. TLI_171]|uniref:hypothetical protein n=1 Tax=Streptomyces sp. TLI_171 TaxID=1938859 RepID=UPI000C4C9E6F|nr:hypothetical protein [Streptomyces sp. TLI_171]RKE22234.1 hypothetical protein BX266_5673 [Streptomyces sp. TLI_171]
MEHEPLTEAELTAIAARASAATPGDWEPRLETRSATGGASCIFVDRTTSDIDNEMYLSHYIGNKQVVSPDPQLDNDLDFIAHARADVPRLVAEVTRLRALLAGVPGQ